MCVCVCVCVYVCVCVCVCYIHTCIHTIHACCHPRSHMPPTFYHKDKAISRYSFSLLRYFLCIIVITFRTINLMYSAAVVDISFLNICFTFFFSFLFFSSVVSEIRIFLDAFFFGSSVPCICFVLSFFVCVFYLRIC